MDHAIQRWRIVAGLLVALLAAAGHAQQRASPLAPERVDFVLGNFQFTLLHELAHAAIWDLEPPIIGPEEYAADYIATLSLLRPLETPRIGAEEYAADYIATLSLLRPLETPRIGADKWLEFALTTADAFVIFWQLGEATNASFPYWDTHALSIQRFYSIACLLYGSDPERFAKVPQLIEMPPQRAGSCEAEYARALKAMDWLLSFAASTQNRSAHGSMSVRYEEPPTRTSTHLLAEIRSRELIEYTLERFDELVALDEDATVVLRSCRMPEAAWIAEQRELIVCYELLDLYYVLSAEQHRDEIDSLLKQ